MFLLNYLLTFCLKSMKIYLYSLGNPDAKYKNTRHNAGRIVCDEFFANSSEYVIKLAQKEFTFIYKVPSVYMNETGKYIKDVMKNKSENDIFVICYDDMDIDFGNIKISTGRSAGGHNGVLSVINDLNTKDFYRIRIGIGARKIKEMSLQDYVLSKLVEEELNILKSTDFKTLFEKKLIEIVQKI